MRGEHRVDPKNSRPYRQEMALEHLPGMADYPVRQALDEGISRVVGLPDLDKLGEILASEPVAFERRL